MGNFSIFFKKNWVWNIALSITLSGLSHGKGYDGFSVSLGYAFLYESSSMEDFQGISSRYVEVLEPGRDPLLWKNAHFSLQYGIPKLPWVVKIKAQFFTQSIPFDVDNLNCTQEACGSISMERSNLELSVNLHYISALNLFNQNTMMDYYQKGEFSHLGHSLFPLFGIGQNFLNPAEREVTQGFPKTEIGYLAGVGYSYIFPSFSLELIGKSQWYKYSKGMQFSANLSYQLGLF